MELLLKAESSDLSENKIEGLFEVYATLKLTLQMAARAP